MTVLSNIAKEKKQKQENKQKSKKASCPIKYILTRFKVTCVITKNINFEKNMQRFVLSCKC